MRGSYLGFGTLRGEHLEPVTLHAERGTTEDGGWRGSLMPHEGQSVALKQGETYTLMLPSGRSSTVVVTRVDAPRRSHTAPRVRGRGWGCGAV